MSETVNQEALDQIFLEARTVYAWSDRQVSSELLKKLHELFISGPTSANCLPMRLVYVVSKEAKEKLKGCLDAGNVGKTMSAPVTAIIAYDREFYEYLPKTFPHADAKSWFVGRPEFAEQTAFRNSSLQGAYLMLGARALGLDCGPMSGFDPEKVRKAFFDSDRYCINFLCNLGYRAGPSPYPRSPRLSFDEVARIV